MNRFVSGSPVPQMRLVHDYRWMYIREFVAYVLPWHVVGGVTNSTFGNDYSITGRIWGRTCKLREYYNNTKSNNLSLVPMPQYEDVYAWMQELLGGGGGGGGGGDAAALFLFVVCHPAVEY